MKNRQIAKTKWFLPFDATIIIIIEWRSLSWKYEKQPITKKKKPFRQTVIAHFLGVDKSREWRNAMIKGRGCTRKRRGSVNQT